MLDAEEQAIVEAAKIEIRVAPGVKFGAAAQGLSRAHGLAAFAGVVDEDDGEREVALQVAQVGEQGRDLGRGIFVDAMKPDEGVEDEQDRTERVDRRLQLRTVFDEIETHAGGGDHLDGQIGEGDAGGVGDALEPCAHQMQRVLGGVQEHGPVTHRPESTQARDAAGDGDDDVEGQEALAALRLAADDADGLVGPEVLDEPAVLGRTDRQVARTGNGQLVIASARRVREAARRAVARRDRRRAARRAGRGRARCRPTAFHRRAPSACGDCRPRGR